MKFAWQRHKFVKQLTEKVQQLVLSKQSQCFPGGWGGGGAARTPHEWGVWFDGGVALRAPATRKLDDWEERSVTLGSQEAQRPLLSTHYHHDMKRRSAPAGSCGNVRSIWCLFAAT